MKELLILIVTLLLFGILYMLLETNTPASPEQYAKVKSLMLANKNYAYMVQAEIENKTLTEYQADSFINTIDKHTKTIADEKSKLAAINSEEKQQAIVQNIAEYAEFASKHPMLAQYINPTIYQDRTIIISLVFAFFAAMGALYLNFRRFH
jgi:hypothetical protein